MKSFFKVITLSALAAGASQGASLSFTNSGAGNLATGFGDSTGAVTGGLIWGLIVDTAGNGFASDSWTAGFSYTGGNTTGIALATTTGRISDDVLYINISLTTNVSREADGAIVGTGRVNSITSATYGAATSYAGAIGTAPIVGGNQNFALVWFDRGIALGSTSAGGQKFGLATSGTGASPVFTTPAANSDTVDFSGAFAGADPSKLATLTLKAVPEPSVCLLGVAGMLGFFRRRRN